MILYGLCMNDGWWYSNMKNCRREPRMDKFNLLAWGPIIIVSTILTKQKK